MAPIVGVEQVDISKLVPSKFNVRRRAGQEDVTELANSIEQHGVLEPIIVRKHDGKFEVIVGSLRVRAAQEVGLKQVPAVIKDISDEEARVESLIENIQRHTLGPDDEADAFGELYRMVKSATKVAEMVGCSETRVKDSLKIKGLIDTLKSTVGPAKTERILEEAPRKRVLSDVARVAETVYRNQPKKAVRLAQEVVDLPEAEAKRVLDRVRTYPEKPIEQIKEEALYAPQSVNIEVQFGSKVIRAIDKAVVAHKSSREEIVELAVRTWLKDEGYL